MRIGYSSQYLTLSRYQQDGQAQLNDMLTQMSSGRKIQFGYQNSSVFSQTLRLDYENATLEQSKTLSTSAKSFSDNTDSALSELSKAMVNFKTKLTHAANQVHSPTSLQALANDLQAIRDHMLSISNTSIGGQYIFSGTDVTKRPFTQQGKYEGNDAHLEALIGSNNLMSYNVTGSELFAGKDSDKSRVIVTNIKNYNQTKLHPDIMTKLNKTDLAKQVYLKSSDTLRDLIGDKNDDTTDSPDEWFYLQGVRPDGSSFKSKFSFTTRFTNEESASKVQDLLDRIGREFGNTSTNKVVDVTLNEYGAIQIKDLTTGRSNIDFYMVSSDANVNNIDELTENGARVKHYVQSPFLGDRSATKVSSVNDYYDHRISQIPSTFRASDNSLATRNTRLADILGANVTNIQIGGNAANNRDGTAGAAVANYNLAITATTTVQDLIDSIKANFAGAGDIDVELTNGKIIVTDKNVLNRTDDQRHPPYDGDSSFSISLTALNAGGVAVSGFRNDYTVEYDRVAFSKSGAILSSNVSQVINKTNDYATPKTRLSDVAGASLHGEAFRIKAKDVNGIDVNIMINFSNTVPPGTTFTINGVDTIPVFNPHDAPPAVTQGRADDMTYQQLMDIVSIAMNHSNIAGTAEYAVATAPAGTLQDRKAAYENLLRASEGKVGVSLNSHGQLEIKDLIRSETRMSFMMYDTDSSNFTMNPATGRPINDEGSQLRFQANNALTIDDPHTSFFSQLDSIISAVRSGTYRAGDVIDGAYSDVLRNVGIQGGMTQIDHLSDHINKVHAKNGAQGNAFKYSLERTETLIVHTKSLRSETIDTDIANTYNNFAQLTLKYQAMLSSIGKINQLSLVNYI
ncbi:MAG: flagellar hook-associated protein FlgL [Wolinella sp.]